MARKSKEIRLIQTHELMEEYKNAHLTHDRCYQFMNDMSQRLQANRALSKGQRKFLDDLIDRGAPTIQNKQRVDEILEAAVVDGMEHVSTTLRDFASKIGKGWSLSDKQTKFLNKLLNEASHVRKSGKFKPSPKMIAQLVTIVSLCETKNHWYWTHRPGTAKAYDKVSYWLQWYHNQKMCRQDVTHADDTGTHEIEISKPPHIDEWSCNKLFHAFKKQLGELKTPKYPEGTMLWIRTMPGHSKESQHFVLVAGKPHVTKGEIVYPCLVNGELMDICGNELFKRKLNK